VGTAEERARWGVEFRARRARRGFRARRARRGFRARRARRGFQGVVPWDK